MRSLNIDQLRTFLAVVGAGSFSAAARNLHLSQPAVSVQIRELERHFGVKLIERFGKQAHATEPGRDLIEAAELIFMACSEADVLMRRYRENWTGRVRIGTTITAQMYLLPAILRQLSRDQPGIDLHVRNMPTQDSVAAILRNEIDLAIVTLPLSKNTDQLKIEPLMTERLVAIHSADERDLPKTVTPAYVLQHDLLLEHVNAGVHNLVIRWLSGHGEAPRARMHLGTIEAVKSGVASGLGFAAMVDPANGQQNPVVSQFLSILATLLFLSMNGHLALATTIVQSYHALPPGHAWLSADSLHGLVLFGGVLFSGLSIALPVAFAIVLVQVLMGLLARSAPQLNLFAVGFPAALLAGVVLLAIATPVLGEGIAAAINFGLEESRRLATGGG